MVRERNQGNGAASEAPCAASLHDLEELSRRGVLVGIQRIDQFEGFLLELFLGHVFRVGGDVATEVLRADVDATSVALPGRMLDIGRLPRPTDAPTLSRTIRQVLAASS